MNEKLTSEFNDLAKEYALDDQVREKIIIISREITKMSKQAIYKLHRGEVNECTSLLADASKKISETKDRADASSLKEVGAFKAALEEFVEAKSYLFFLNNKTIPSREELDLPISVHYETYLLGLSDLSGELVRRCVRLATDNKVDEVTYIYDVVDELFGLWLQFDFRTSELRKKFDTMRYNVSKIQTIVYELSMRNK